MPASTSLLCLVLKSFHCRFDLSSGTPGRVAWWLAQLRKTSSGIS